MRFPIFQRLLTLVALCLFFSAATFAQNSSRDFVSPSKTKNSHIVPKAKKPAPVKKKRVEVTMAVPADCNNDVTVPEIQCPAGTCLPDARAAYLVSNYGEPWGQVDNIVAMEAVFGIGNWDALYFESADITTLLSPAYKVIFLDGSYMGGLALDAFLTAHLPALEAWVAAGGALFINGATNSGYTPETINYGFGGVTLQTLIYISDVAVQEPGHPIFNGPFTPANGNFQGSSFLHGVITGPVGSVLLVDVYGAGTGLAEKKYGAGKVFFGSMTMPTYHSPHPNAQNLRQNILADLNALCNDGLIVAADAGECFATVSDQSLDATATDDCALASLTHDVAGSPDNTTLSGTVFPIGSNLVTWTAVDASGNTSTCEVRVTIREEVTPEVACPEAILVAANEGTCGAVVEFTITSTDNCTPAPSIVSIPASGETFPIGTTTVFVTATDESGNTATCSFDVTVTANPELCNGLDDDCNGLTDDGAPGDNIFYADTDGDGYGDPDNSETGCLASPGFVDNALDCDDANYYIQPGAYEYCNGVDDNCDGNIDEGVAPLWYADTDGDGYGDPGSSQYACEQPAGYVYDNTDCDDTESYFHPGTLEDCTNSIDENCDGILGDNNFTIEETHTDVYCGSTPDGTISLTIAPAQNYPFILWSNGAQNTTTLTNLQNGTYKVTVTNECGTFKTKTIVIEPSQTPALQVTMTGTENICGGAGNGEITATAQDGCGDYTYEWNTGGTQPSISGLSGGVYTVVVTDACGCTQTGMFTVNEAELLSVYVGAAIPLLDGTYFVQVVPYGGTAPYKFRRNILSGGFTDWSASNGFLGVSAGDYVFEVEDNQGCLTQVDITLSPLNVSPEDDPSAQSLSDNTDQSIELPARTNTDQEAIERLNSGEQNWSVSLFPNPNSGVFTVELPAPPAETTLFYITDASGRILMKNQAEPGSKNQMITAEILLPGSYFLQVVMEGRVIAVEKFIKQ